MAQALVEDPTRTALIANDVEAEMERAGGPLLVVSGSEDQNRVLSDVLERRGIRTVVIPDATDPSTGDGNEREQRPVCLDVPIPEGPNAVLVTAGTLGRCALRMDASAVFLAFPVYFRKPLAEALRAIHPFGANGDGRLKIYDYVDRRVGLLENYFRMRSYNYGVHPDLLLGTPSQN